MPKIIVRGRNMAPKWTSHCSRCGCIAEWKEEEFECQQRVSDRRTAEIYYWADCPNCKIAVMVSDAANTPRDTHS